jgi:hypothetical protein
MIRRFPAQPTMMLFGQPQADHPTPRQRKASAGHSNHQANDQCDNGGNGDGHGDTPSIRNSTIVLMATKTTDHLTTWAQSRIGSLLAMRPLSYDYINRC